MSSNTPNKEDYVLNMQADIRRGLSALDEKKNWIDLYEKWREDEKNQFSSLLMVTDSFNLSCAGDCYSYDNTDKSHMVDLDIMKMSVFLSEHLRQLSIEVFENVRKTRSSDKIISIIECYFAIVDGIANSHELAGCIVTLNEAAEKQMVLQGVRSVDLYVCFYLLRELLRKETTESLFLLYTYWRITKSKKNLKSLVNAISDYIQVYFDDFDNDPQMHLHYPSVSNTDNSRSESSRTENSNNSSTVNNYYQQDKQEPSTASTNASQPVNVTVPVTVSTPEAKGSYTATTEAPESTSIADKNINIEAKGVDVKLEITGDSYNISISAPEGQESQIQPVNEVSTVNAPESTTEPQRSPNWIEYITVILLAVLVGLEIKDKLHKEK